MKFTRKEIWNHNGFLGSTRMAYLAMVKIRDSKTASDESRAFAWEALCALDQLAKSLKKRRDQV